MLDISSVSGVFICTLEVFHLDVYIYLQWLHTCFQVFSGVFARVIDVCCKCFSCFGRMLQVFHLNIAKVDRMSHMLQ
jgi:hypothetical protein